MLQSRRLGMWLASLPLCFAASCGVASDDVDDTASVEQALGPNCVIQRPYAWQKGTGSCVEDARRGALTLAPGESFMMSGGGGSVTVVCNASGNGRWVEQDKWCNPPGDGKPL